LVAGAAALLLEQGLEQAPQLPVALLQAMRHPSKAVTVPGGYWLVSSGGTVYAYGSAHNYGSLSGTHPAIVGIVATPDAKGYWLIAEDGNVYHLQRHRGVGAHRSRGHDQPGDPQQRRQAVPA
jgi:hypothetical protein